MDSRPRTRLGTASIDAVLARYDLDASSDVMVVPAGTLNDNYRVSSGTRQFFVRHHRADRDRDQIIAEHALVVWVGERGITDAAAR